MIWLWLDIGHFLEITPLYLYMVLVNSITARNHWHAATSDFYTAEDTEPHPGCR